MIQIFFITFFIHLIIVYIYLYNFFDSNILFISSGSKIREMSRDSPINFNYIKNVLFKYNSKEILNILILIVILFVSNLLLFLKLLTSNFIPIKILDKTIDLVTTLGDKLNLLFIVYYVVYIVFLIIVCPKIYNFIKSKKAIKNEYPISCKSKINLGLSEREEDIAIDIDSLYQNLLITGSIGSGKTSSCITPICKQLIERGKGGLILDIKGNFVDTVEKLCEKTNRKKDLKIISLDSNQTFELLPDNMSNLEIASILKQTITLISPSNMSDSYWLDKVQDVILNLLIVQEYSLKQRNIYEIHKMVTSDEYLKEKIEECKQELLKAQDDEKVIFEMQGAISFIKNEYMNLDERIRSIIRSEITRLTVPLVTEYPIYNRFCNSNNEYEKIDFTNSKQIVVLSLDIGKNKTLAKIISVFLKVQFQREILSRIKEPIPTFFIADEYQEFVNIEDARFLSLSREARCMNIISTQSYSSIRNTLKDEMATNVIIQNLVNKIWFRNDDNYTIQEIIKQLGKKDVQKETTQISEGAQESKKYLFKTGFKNKKSNISRSISKVTSKENEYDENFFTRELKIFEALAFYIKKEDGVKVEKIKMERYEI